MRRIVIADENRDLRAVLAFKFEHQHDTVVHADSTKAAFYEVIEEPTIPRALIVGDFGPTTEPMLTLITNLRTIYDTDELPIIVVSSHASPRHAQEALQSGASTFIPRPIQRLDEVVDAVNALLKIA